MESKSECLEADRKLVYFELQSHLNLHFDVGLHFLVDKYLAMFYHWMEFAPFKNDFFNSYVTSLPCHSWDRLDIKQLILSELRLDFAINIFYSCK